jgi:uncharacterized damage-inducible protein DinB
MSDLLEIRAAARARSAADHAGTVRAFYPYWDAQYRPYLIAAVNAFPVPQLDYKPRPEMLTARQIAVHIAEAEINWITKIVEGGTQVESEDWILPAEDPAQGWRSTVDAPDHAALQSLLARSHEATQRWLDHSADELGRLFRRVFSDGVERTYTLHWILDHVQEHEIHHRAQLNLYLRLLGIEPPGI